MKPLEDGDFSPDSNSDLRKFDAIRYLHTSPPVNRIEGSILTKMSVGAVSLTAIVAIAAIKVMFQTHGEDAKIDPAIATAILAPSAVVGAMLGAVLALKDRIQRKLENKEHVSYFLRLLFGSGNTSLAIWISWIFLTCLVIIPVVLSLKPF